MSNRNEENKIYKKLEEIIIGNMGITIRKLNVSNIEIYLLYVIQIIDREMLSQNIIKPIVQYKGEVQLNTAEIINSIIYMDDVFIDCDENKIVEYILDGNSIVFVSSDEKYLVADTYKIDKRIPETPEISYTMKAPRDSFTESMDSNISLIRYRIKDPNLRIDNLIVGKRTKTHIAVIYINDVANPKYVSQVKNSINGISIDGVVQIAYIQKYLANSTFGIFPQSGIVERSDMACADLLEGKVVILIEGGNLAISVPKLFVDFLDSGDDHYDDLYTSTLVKFIRFTAMGITLSLSALYVAVIGFHSDILPTEYVILLATMRATVPLNSILEAFLMEFIAEILKEASIRLPSHIGPAFGIVGTLVIGQAAVAAGVVSPLMVIIIGLSTMCSFIVSDHSIMNPIRILKFLMISITGVFGLLGFVLGFTFIVVTIISTTSLGAAFSAPIAPFNFKDFKSYIFSEIRISPKRPKALNVRNRKRQ